MNNQQQSQKSTDVHNFFMLATISSQDVY